MQKFIALMAHLASPLGIAGLGILAILALLFVPKSIKTPSVILILMSICLIVLIEKLFPDQNYYWADVNSNFDWPHNDTAHTMGNTPKYKGIIPLRQVNDECGLPQP